jgi:hypothetical protein
MSHLHFARRILAAGTLAVAAALPATTAALAASPDTQLIVNEFEGIDAELSAECGTTILVRVDDSVRVTTFFNADGSPREYTALIRGSTTWTNAATGSTRTQSYARVIQNAFSGTPTFLGLAVKVVATGVHQVDAGRITVDFQTFDVLFEAGPHPSFYSTDSPCDDLA